MHSMQVHTLTLHEQTAAVHNDVHKFRASFHIRRSGYHLATRMCMSVCGYDVALSPRRQSQRLHMAGELLAAGDLSHAEFEELRMVRAMQCAMHYMMIEIFETTIVGVPRMSVAFDMPVIIALSTVLCLTWYLSVSVRLTTHTAASWVSGCYS